MWEEETYPETFSTSTLIPIQKPCKPRADPASYRPISLSSCASKIIERMVNGRIKVYIENNNLLSEHQNGFRPNRSTTDSIAHIINSIYTSFHNKEVTVALFIDLKAAFDKVNHQALLIKIHKLGLRGRIAKYIKNFISNRTIAVRCGNTYSTKVKQDHGLPQGSPLSPTLFLILINDIFDNIRSISNKFNFSMYADDLAVWVSQRSTDSANTLMQLALNKIEEWCDFWGLTISPTKSATMIFSNNRLHVTPHLPLQTKGQNIPLVEKFKYLGIVLDRKLTFAPHITYIIQKCSRRINIMKSIAGSTWGADRKILLHLYVTLVRPILEYNSFLLINISNTLVNKLETVQNTALRIATGAIRTTNTDNLRIETNITTLEERREHLLLRYQVKSLSRFTRPACHIFQQESRRNLNKTQKRFPTYNMQIDYILEKYENIDIPESEEEPPLRDFLKEKRFDTYFLIDEPKKDLNPIEIQQIFNNFKVDFGEYNFIFTDGSQTDEKTGSAFVHEEYIFKKRLTNFHSIFSAELTAMKEAMLYAKRKQIRKVIICTDSRAALMALNSIQYTNHPTLEQIRQIHTTSDLDIKFIWIPGHSGIPGNEKADKAAKESLSLRQYENICPVADIISTLNREHKKNIQKRWTENPHYHLYPIKPKIGTWATSNQDTRQKERILARLRLGQTKLTHSYIMEHTEPPNCTLCNCRYTIEHFLINCPRYRTQRQPIINYINNNEHESI